MRSLLNIVVSSLLLAHAACAIAGRAPLPTPTVAWNTSLRLGWGTGLEQISEPGVGNRYIFVSDTVNVTVVDRRTGAFVRNIVCSNSEEGCTMFAGSAAAGDTYVCRGR
jgi:hypothetical protein